MSTINSGRQWLCGVLRLFLGTSTVTREPEGKDSESLRIKPGLLYMQNMCSAFQYTHTPLWFALSEQADLEVPGKNLDLVLTGLQSRSIMEGDVMPETSTVPSHYNCPTKMWVVVSDRRIIWLCSSFYQCNYSFPLQACLSLLCHTPAQCSHAKYRA